MPRRPLVAAALLPLAPLLIACSGPGGAADGGEASSADSAAGTDARPHVAAATPVEAGRYLVHVAGCNDCHTGGWLREQGQVPRSEWLTGSRVGFRGPWGTTYPSNLRRTVREVTEDEWVVMMETRNRKPPMPWFNVHAMSEGDQRAIYRFIETLGPPGDSVPAAVPPGETPRTPYYDFVPKTPEEGG